DSTSRRDSDTDTNHRDGAEKNTSPHKDQGNSTNKDLSERSSRPLPKISRSIGVERAGKMREAYPILDKIEHKLGSGQDFLKNFTDLVNKHPVFLDAFYDKRGHTFSKDLEGNGQRIPPLT